MKICIPVREKSMVKALNQVKKANKYADFIEIWLDSLSGADYQNLIRKAKKPVIAVCRGKEEKGSFRGGEEERITMLKGAVQAGASFIDVGLQTKNSYIQTLGRLCRKHKVKLILSKHFWGRIPDMPELLNFVKSASRNGADIVKIATRVAKWSDNAVLFELTQRITEKNGKIIVVGMGEIGKISRIGCPLLGSYLTYVALDRKSRTAHGQMTRKEFYSSFYYPKWP